MIRHFEILQFDNKSNLGIIQITRLRCVPTHSRAPLHEIYCFIYFPTPLYTKTRCQAGFCVSPYFSGRKVGKRLSPGTTDCLGFTRPCRRQRPALFIRLPACGPVSPKLYHIPVPVFRSGDFLVLIAPLRPVAAVPRGTRCLYNDSLCHKARRSFLLP